MTTLWLDFESRSRCDLLKHGAYRYAADPSTEIVIASYAIDHGPIARWMLHSGHPRPAKLINALADPKVEIRAHNAAFERLMLAFVWKLAIPPERFHCTAYQARAAALPASLEDMGRALTAKLQKDRRGYELIRALSIPREDGSFSDDAGLYAEFGAYCDQDVGAMRVASLMLPALTQEARASYTANEAVNDRGLPIDLELCEWAMRYADEEREEAEARITLASGGSLTKARGRNLTQWLYDRLPPEGQRLMLISKRRMTARTSEASASTLRAGGSSSTLQVASGEQYDTLTLDTDTREALFALSEAQPGLFGDDVLAVLEANDAAMGSSVYKFRSMLDTASDDGRLRGAFIANGASGTGRFSSKGAQLHNFPRVCAKDPEAIRRLMKKHAALPGPVIEVLKSMLRPAVCPGPGRRIVRCDWSAIEARVLPWLTMRASAVKYLDAFTDDTRDIYVEQARACGLTDRQAGKVVVLSLGFGGGERALAAMCKGYGVQIEGKQTVVRRWRSANRWAPEFWHDLERKARWALAGKGSDAGRVALEASAPGAVPGLIMELPSGRRLHYPMASVSEDSIDYLRAAWKPKADATAWPRAKLWGGLIAENATQAAAACLLRAALVGAVAAGYPVIGHVHDELVGEATTKGAAGLARALADIMMARRDWAGGLPLSVETDVSPRYRK